MDGWKLLMRAGKTREDGLKFSYIRKYYICEAADKALIVRVFKTETEKYVELEDVLYQKKYKYVTKTLKKANHIAQILMRNQFSFNEVIDKMDHAHYYFDSLEV
jgi:SOS response regulatory protein OraA/RecX